MVIANGTREALANAIRRMRGVKAMAAPTVTADFFDGGDVIEQAQWIDNLRKRTTYPPQADPGYVTLLDTGVSRAHPLVKPALEIADRHAANPAWGLEDIQGHGTHMAGLALFGDLTSSLHQANPVTVSNRLESVKLVPDAGANPHHLLGAVTRGGVNTVEQIHPRRRTFTMPLTTGEDTPHDGAPLHGPAKLINWLQEHLVTWIPNVLYSFRLEIPTILVLTEVNILTDAIMMTTKLSPQHRPGTHWQLVRLRRKQSSPTVKQQLL